MEYTVDYFIAKFEAIPEYKWHMDTYVHPLNEDTCCALGHCGERVYCTTDEAGGLKGLFYDAHKYIESDCIEIFIVDINDGNNARYQQTTPKQRILAALHDIKKQQENG